MTRVATPLIIIPVVVVGIGPAAAEIVAREQSTPPLESISGTPGEFMIGVTAAVSASVYSQHGYMDVDLTTPLTIGVFHGSILAAALRHYGSAIFRRADGHQCRTRSVETTASASVLFAAAAAHHPEI